MEIHQLKYFVAVAETGSFSRAAERCRVAQPSLSQQIIKLEQDLGQSLFHRQGRKVILSDAGERLLPRANVILAEVWDIRQGLRQKLDDERETLSVGIIPTVSLFVLPRVVRIFQQTYPHATLSVHEDYADGLVCKLISEKLDIGIISLPVENKVITTQELLTETLLVACSRRNDPFPRGVILSKEMDGAPFIAFSELHCLAEQVRMFCHQQQITPQILSHVTQFSTLQSCVALGLGISLVPQALAITDPQDEIIYRPISDITPQRKILAATHASRKPSFLASEFARMTREEYPVEKIFAVPAS